MTSTIDHSGERVRPKRRSSVTAHSPESFQALSHLSEVVDGTSLERSLALLIWIRASQINGCAYCIDMHTVDARAEGETEQRIYALSAWRETPFFTERERAALALAEAVTLISEGHVPDDVYEEAARVLDQRELTSVVWHAVAINAWNRVAITSRSERGHYTPGGG
jgi:AhpD family alkylhydroperoxidase